MSNDKKEKNKNAAELEANFNNKEDDYAPVPRDRVKKMDDKT